MFQGGGNIPLLMPVVTELVRRGHEVHVLAGPGIRPNRLPINEGFIARLAASGASYEALPAPQPHPFDAVPPTRGIQFGWAPGELRVIAATQARTTLWSPFWAQQVLRRLKDGQPDVLASDFYLFGAMAAGEAAGVPTAALVHNAFPPDAPGQPPRGLGFRPPESFIERLKQETWRRAYERIWIRDGLPAHNRARIAVGLKPLKSPLHQYAASQRVLVLGSAAFDFDPERAPANVRYVGTPIDDGDVAEDVWQSPWGAEAERPLVMVSLSTLPQGQAQVMHNILAALGGMQVRALVTLGPLRREDFSPASNTVLERFVPHSAILPRVSAMITQCGLGGLTKALIQGVPIVCMPLVGDQPDNAARVTARGAGIRLPVNASAKDIRGALSRVLSEPAYREAARDLGSAMRVIRAEEGAAVELEQLAWNERL